jgi:hypothetical protein
MSEDTRADLIEFKRLNSSIDLEGMSFDKVIELIVGFLDSSNLDALLADCNLIVDVNVLSKIQYSLGIAHQALIGTATAAQLSSARVLLWNLYDAQIEGSNEKKLIRVAVSGLYDEESAEFATFGSEAMFETFFSVLLDLSPGCCKRFADFAIRRVAQWK